MTGGSGNGTAGASGDGEKEGEEEEPGYAPLVDPRLPTRKDTSLREFISKIDDYAPIIPEGVTNYYMTKAGLPPPPQTDPRLARLLALATQKFVADIAADAYQYSRIRASNSSAANNPMGNLGMAAGIPMPGQQAGAGGGGGAAAVGMAGAAVGGASKGGQGGAAGQQLLGIQRPGFGGGGQGGSQNRTVLTMEDLGMAVGEYGVNVKRSEFYR
ncbi:transcription initiation factor TFIID 23-30kDa subunit-domain-containing protein [Coniella lustricola]|uniref:Transcription initiation factor TFIID subunit 10 n=1 Tax=Coniella lustricola TaxID=2025994 RepID=A0A2T2ZWC4_9PEZI|nr:transcription initiation factor TFIID 23-30kDa subunit-domain-containing protein [Coniella lustricola]